MGRMDADFFLYWRRVAEGGHRSGNECSKRILLPTRIRADVRGYTRSKEVNYHGGSEEIPVNPPYPRFRMVFYPLQE